MININYGVAHVIGGHILNKTYKKNEKKYNFWPIVKRLEHSADNGETLVRL